MPEEMARPLPYRDMNAIFDVLLIFYGELLNGDAAPDPVARLMHRMSEDGFLPLEASVGELAATIGDLIQRMHYAMGDDDDELPPPSPRVVWHSIYASTEGAAQACRSELINAGSAAVLVRETKPGVWEALASLPDLPPDPSFVERQTQLRQLAQRHKSRYSGWHG